jgi:DNA-binding transcriptional ArsR family regulator
VSEVNDSRFAFLTNHAQVLLCIAGEPAIRLREIGAQVGITERAAHRIIGELEQAGYVTRHREGRRNRYTIEPHLPLPDPLARERQVRDLLAILGPGAGSAGDSKRRAS